MLFCTQITIVPVILYLHAYKFSDPGCWILSIQNGLESDKMGWQKKGGSVLLKQVLGKFFFFPVAAKNKIILNSLTDQC